MPPSKELLNHLSIALKFLPKGYEDYHLSNKLQDDTLITLEAHILNYTHFRTAASVKFFSPLFNSEFQAVIFNAKPFHKAMFIKGLTLFLQAKYQENNATFIQPKQIPPKKINTIVLKFKQNTIKYDEVIQIITQSITPSALSILPKKYANALLKIYYPDIDFLQEFQKHKGFFGEYLEAIKFLDIYLYSQSLRSKKLSFPPIKKLTNKADNFISTLSFPLTQGQIGAIQDIEKDFQGKKATRRVIIGDVGCGKTLVILCAVFMAYPNRSVIMAPTSILANQLYREALKYLPKYFKIALVTQQSNKKDMDINAHCIIGTHALLYRELDNIALMIIDEQHRFGTTQRNNLEKSLSKGDKRVHFLQFSATPIPRTFAMIESNFIDFSFIKDLPYPKDIQTSIITKPDINTLLQHIKTETQKGNQCAIIYPLVEESQKSKYLSLSQAQDFWKKTFDGVYVTHGSDRQKDAILEEFAQKGNILLSTTVVEVGISLPKLSTIVIVGAEKFGLATLHQLRGRVSRNGLKGYCFLFTYTGITERLDRFCQTQNGFEIAELDLEFRESGDILNGSKQSGKTFDHFNPATDNNLAKEAQGLLDTQYS